MSAELLGLAFKAEMGTHVAKLVLLKLVDAGEDDGTSIYPAVATIARAAQAHERTVQKLLKLFQKVGLLELVRQGGGGPGDTNEYRLNLDMLRRIKEVGWARATGEEDAEGGVRPPLAMGGIESEKGGIEDAKGGELSHPTPPIDPSLDPVIERERTREDGGSKIPDWDLLEKLIALHPQGAHDTIAAIATPWRKLQRAERREALDHFPGWLDEKGKRSAIAGLPTYLGDKMFQRVKAAVQAASAVNPRTKAFDHLWWWMFFDFVSRYRAQLVDRTSGPAALLRKRVSFTQQYAGGWPLADVDLAEIEPKAQRLRNIHKDSGEARAWQHRLAMLGVTLPSPDKANWIFVPEGDADDWLADATLIEASEVMG